MIYINKFYDCIILEKISSQYLELIELILLSKVDSLEKLLFDQRADLFLQRLKWEISQICSKNSKDQVKMELKDVDRLSKFFFLKKLKKGKKINTQNIFQNFAINFSHFFYTISIPKNFSSLEKCILLSKLKDSLLVIINESLNERII